MKTVYSLFFVYPPSETIEGLYGSIHTQWRVYQTKLIPEDWYKNCSEENALSYLQRQYLYWEYTFSICMVEPVLTTLESYCGMGKFWQKVGTMADSDG